MIYMSKDAKTHKDVESEEGIIISGPQSLPEQTQWLLPKMEQLKSYHNMTYYISLVNQVDRAGSDGILQWARKDVYGKMDLHNETEPDT